MPQRTVILIRHAQSEHHVLGLSGGWTDTPLTNLGHSQAQAVANRLRAELKGIPIRLFSSDLLRTQDTAGHISAAFGVEPILDWRLREFNNGEAANLTLEGPVPIVVTHGGTLDTMTARWLHFAEEKVSHIGFATHVTGITVLQKDELGHRRVERANDISHLAGLEGHVGLGSLLG